MRLQMPNAVRSPHRGATHLSCIVGAGILEVALLLDIDAVLCLIVVLVGAIEIDLLLLPQDLDGFRGGSLRSRLCCAQQQP